MLAPSEGVSKEKAVHEHAEHNRRVARRIASAGPVAEARYAIGANVLTVQRAVGRSRIGRAYEFTLDVLSTDSDVELKS